MSNSTASKVLPRVSPAGRISFPQLFEAKQINGQGDPKFGCTMIFEPNAPGLQQMRDAVQKVISTKWNGKIPANYKDPFIDGDETGRPEYKGKVIIRLSAKADKRPEIVGPMKEPIGDPARIYSGAWCRVSYNAYGWTYMGKSGVSFGLGHVQLIRDGERLDGRGTADSVFDAYEDEGAWDDEQTAIGNNAGSTFDCI